MLGVVDPLDDIDKLASNLSKIPTCSLQVRGSAPYYTGDSIEGQPGLQLLDVTHRLARYTTTSTSADTPRIKPKYNATVEIVESPEVDRGSGNAAYNQIREWEDNDIRHHGIDNTLDWGRVNICPCTGLNVGQNLARTRIINNKALLSINSSFTGREA